MATLREAPSSVAARFEQVIEEQAENVIRLNERAIRIEDAKPICIAIGGQARESLILEYGFFQWRKVFFRRVRAGTVEQHVALGADRRDRNAIFDQDAVEPAGANAMDGVTNETSLGFLQHIEADHATKLIEVGRARIDRFEIVFDFMVRVGVILQSGGAPFDVLGYFRWGRPAFRAGKFQAIVAGRIVAGGYIHAPVELAVNDRVRDRWSGSGRVAKQHAAAMRPQHRRGRACKFLGKKARIVTDDQRRILLLRENVCRQWRLTPAGRREK